MVNEQEKTVVALAFLVSGISLLCTLTNLWLIRVMKKWNGYLAIITMMCCCQIVYDVTFALHLTANDGGTAIAILNALQFFGGMSVSLWTNILAIIILRVVMWMKSTDILDNIYYIGAVAMVPSAVLGIVLLILEEVGRRHQVYAVEELYYWARLASIIVNFVAHAIIEIRAYRTRSRRAVSMRTPQEMAIKVLAQRMIYYPLIQTICRLGAAIYEARYGFGPYTGNSSNTKFALACCYAALSPATGIGYLFIFLLMQPYAMDQLRSIVSTGSSIDQTTLEIRKRNFRRSSFMNRGTLNRRTGGGSECMNGSSLTTPSDMANNTSSVSAPSSAVLNETADEYYFMDDEELVNTIQRVESKSQQQHRYSTSEHTVNTLHTAMTTNTLNTLNTTNPVYRESSDTYSVGPVTQARATVSAHTDFNEQL